MSVSFVIATCGDQSWSDLAFERAYPSADGQRGIAGERAQVVAAHYPELTVAQARNAAARDATEDWLCFLDADDELEPGYLAAMQASLGHFLNQGETAGTANLPPLLLVPAVRYVYAFERGDARIPNRGGWPRTNECVIGTLVRRDLFEQVGGFRDHTDDGTELVSIEDYDLWLRCWDAGATLVYVPGAVYRAYVSGGRSRNSDQSPYAAIWADHETRIAARDAASGAVGLIANLDA